ncbi:MAG: GNAT family N-acetyltransferase [Pseudomonadota bacterium]
MGMTVNVRPIRAKDQVVWRKLWTGYLRFYESAVSEDVYESTFQRLLTDEPYEPSGLIAWDGEKALGLVHFMYHRHCWRIENVCYLQDLFALPEARGKGVGRTLIEAVYAQADAKGCPVVYWNTADDNATARQLYDRIAHKTQFIKYQR